MVHCVQYFQYEGPVRGVQGFWIQISNEPRILDSNFKMTGFLIQNLTWTIFWIQIFYIFLFLLFMFSWFTDRGYLRDENDIGLDFCTGLVLSFKEYSR